MSSALTALALQIGVPLIGQVLTRRIGATNAQLATDVVGALARRLGVTVSEVEALAEENPPRVIDAMRETERAMPEMIALHATALEGQFALLKAEQDGPWWGWAWRPLTMWLLAFLWLWSIVILHVANAVWRIALPQPDLAMLFSLTGVYMALYMGGHTIKEWARLRTGGAH
ncbi:hypothetical protein [Pararhodobacter sp.]|uniref:hypothetical protein n=1 Tax=Pararhodobacter sp. TaxID=2127056 RepID=UPI002AFE1E56|nr:hypothetical protein [Pararhodobacter sp.]